MRTLIACLLALALTGCWMSERPEIPIGELVQPAGLPGRYWALSLDDAGSGLGLIEFRRGEDGTMIGDDAGKSDGGVFRLARTSVPGVYVKIIDYDENSVVYGLLEHRDLGAWQDYGIDAVGEDALTGPSLAWMQEIASRYGLIINASDPDETRIEGEIDGMAIPSLFADPAFLAALRVVPSRLYVPSPPAPEEREELFPQGETSLQLQLDQAGLAGAEWVTPDGLEGEFHQGQSIVDYSRQLGLRVARLPDGRFEISAMDPQSNEGRSQILGLLPLNGLANEYLAVSFDRWKYEDKESHYLTLWILGRTEKGWSLANVLVRGTETIAGRQDLLSQPMSEAAQRQGATLDGFRLRGGLTAQSLLALLRDGQFTIGLQVDQKGATYFNAGDPEQGQP